MQEILLRRVEYRASVGGTIGAHAGHPSCLPWNAVPATPSAACLLDRHISASIAAQSQAMHKCLLPICCGSNMTLPAMGQGCMGAAACSPLSVHLS